MLKPTLFCIHGYWATPATFTGLKARFEAAGYQVITPALPFHDRDPSLPPPPGLGELTVEDYADFLVAEVQRIEGPVILVGHSMGGMLAQIVAARVAHAGLILLSTAPTAATGTVALDTIRTMFGVVTKWGWWEDPTRIDYDRWRWGIGNGLPEAIARAEYAALVWDSGRVMAEMTLPGLSATGATKVDYTKLAKPALVIVGADDRTTVPGISRATARKLAGTVDYHELPDTGHWLFWGETEIKVGDWIAEWLVQFEAPAG